MSELTVGDKEQIYFILSGLLDLGTRYNIAGIIENEEDWNEISDLREKFK